MLNKSFGVFYFHFNIFSTKTAKKNGANFYIFGFLKMRPRSVHLTLLKGRRWLPCPFSKTGKRCPDFKFPIYKSSHGRCSVKKMLLESHKIHRETLMPESLFVPESLLQVFLESLLQPQACKFIKKETPAQVFSCEFCKTSEKPFSYKTPSGDCFCI